MDIVMGWPIWRRAMVTELGSRLHLDRRRRFPLVTMAVRVPESDREEEDDSNGGQGKRKEEKEGKGGGTRVVGDGGGAREELVWRWAPPVSRVLDPLVYREAREAFCA